MHIIHFSWISWVSGYMIKSEKRIHSIDFLPAVVSNKFLCYFSVFSSFSCHRKIYYWIMTATSEGKTVFFAIFLNRRMKNANQSWAMRKGGGKKDENMEGVDWNEKLLFLIINRFAKYWKQGWRIRNFRGFFRYISIKLFSACLIWAPKIIQSS